MFKRKEKEEEPVLPKKRTRKKKEVVKPWGHQERLVILIFLILAPALSLLFLYHSKNSAPQVLGEKITNSRPSIISLKEELTNKTKNLTGTYGIWVQSLDNSFSFGINENEDFDGASLFKLPLMIAYYQDVDSGQIDPNTTYTLKYADLQTGAGILASEPPGTILTYQQIADSLGKNSDNTGFSILGNVLGWDKELGVIGSLGMTNTDLETSTTTPHDMGNLLYKLATTNLISENSKKQMFNSLTDTDYEDLIPSKLPSVRVVHKYGEDNGELNDAGIIYANNPFILVIMSKDINYNEAKSEIPNIAKVIFDWAKK